MSSITIMSLSTLAELGLALLALGVFLREKSLRQRFSALIVYLSLRVAEGFCANLLFLSHYARKFGIHPLNAHQVYVAYFYSYWTLYLLGALVTFFVVLQLFHAVMAPLPGLDNLGIRIFYWIGAICFLMAAASGLLPVAAEQTHHLVVMATAFMRCVSVMELCMFLILLLVVRKLGLSYRSQIFGLGLGFALIAFTNLFLGILNFRHPSLTSISNFIQEFVVLGTLGVWTYYGFSTEPERKPIMLPVTSSLIRWNEIAVALGFGEAKVAVMSSEANTYLPEVEKAVDRVMTKSSVGQAS